MIKPIVYRHIEEKQALDHQLMVAIPRVRRMAAAKELMEIFAQPMMDKHTSATAVKS